MDMAVLVVGFVMGFIVCYFTLGPGSKKKNKDVGPGNKMQKK